MNQSEAGFVISTRRKLRDDVAKTEARAKQRNYIEIKKNEFKRLEKICE